MVRMHFELNENMEIKVSDIMHDEFSNKEEIEIELDGVIQRFSLKQAQELQRKLDKAIYDETYEDLENRYYNDIAIKSRIA